MIGVAVTKEMMERQVPKVALTLDEVHFSFGSQDLVKRLRKLGVLYGKRLKRTILFDAEHVRDVWGRYYSGEVDDKLGV